MSEHVHCTCHDCEHARAALSDLSGGSATPAEILSDTAKRATTLAIREQIAQDLASTLTRDQIRDLHCQLDTVVNVAQHLPELIRYYIGEQATPGTLAGKLVALTQMGTGYFREARDTIEAAFRARNSIRASERPREKR